MTRLLTVGAAAWGTGGRALTYRGCYAGNFTMADGSPTILFLCTGNAARSVMAAAMLRDVRTDLRVTSAGTHSIPGLPMSSRTRTALAGFNVSDPTHLSAQLEQDMVDEATVIAIFEPMHLSYMRKKHADAGHKVASLPRLARDMPQEPEQSIAARLRQMDLDSHTFQDWEEVIDPAGGDLGVFEAAAEEIHRLIAGFSTALGTRA